MFVARDTFQVLLGQEFGQPFADHDHAEFFLIAVSRTRIVVTMRRITSSTRMTGCITFSPVSGSVNSSSRAILAGDVFDADHQARLAGDRCAVGQPTGIAPIVSAR